MRSVAVGALVVLCVAAGFLWGAALGYTESVPGDPNRFDPVGRLPEVARFACDGCQLVEMDAHGVAPDGTVDLNADYEPMARYEFEAPTGTTPTGPIGSGGPQVDHVRVEVGAPRMTGSSDNQGNVSSFYNFGMSRNAFPVSHPDGSQAIDPPCVWTELWRHALAQGAPENAVAWIRYDRNGYEFQISGTKHRHRFDGECQPREK